MATELGDIRMASLLLPESTTEATDGGADEEDDVEVGWNCAGKQIPQPDAKRVLFRDYSEYSGGRHGF